MSSILSRLAYRYGFAQLYYWFQGVRLRKRLVAEFSTHNNSSVDCVIWQCDSICQCGGLCDRLQGIVSAYSIAQQNHQDFRIISTHSFFLDQYLEPNLVDWRIKRDCVNYHKAIVRQVPMMQGRFHATWEEERDFHRQYLSRLFCRAGTKIVYTNAHLEVSPLFSRLFFELFKPATYLQTEIDFHIGKIGKPFVGASFRFRNLLGDFSEPGSLPLNSKEKTELIKRCISQIEILHLKKPNHIILVTSDSSHFCNMIQSLPYVYCVQGVRGHIAFQGVDAVLCSFLDLFLLSKSEGNILYISEQLYRSGFAETASFIGNVPFSIVHF